MKKLKQQNFHVYNIFSAIIFMSGLLLLIYMVSVEGEPGALPLLLLLLGSVGLLFRYIQLRKHTKSNIKS